MKIFIVLFNPRVLLGLITGIVLCGCNATVETATTIPPAKTANLRPGDNLVINLQSIPDPVQINTQIDDQGYISLRYLGLIEASGYRESELAEEIQNAYIKGKIYPSIDVSISVTERYVYVGGEVARPGRVIWSPDLSLTKAIQAAGGFSIYARKIGVILNREEGSYTVDAKSAERNPVNDPRLFPGDSINVPRSPH